MEEAESRVQVGEAVTAGVVIASSGAWGEKAKEVAGWPSSSSMCR